MEALQMLSRKEMKKIRGGRKTRPCLCNYGDCSAALHQYSGGWKLELHCQGEDLKTYTGSGSYGGTVCGGAC